MRWLSDTIGCQIECLLGVLAMSHSLHALSSPKGDFPTHRHNIEIRDITCSLLSAVSHDVTLVPTLQLFDGHTLRYASAITDDGARADIQAKGFWGTSHQRALFDIKVFS